MIDRKSIEKILAENNYHDFKWISGKDIVVKHWVRFKCMFGCPSYGNNNSCPPEVPNIDDCRALFLEYEQIAVIHFTTQLGNPDDRAKWSRKINNKLSKLERAVFLSGCHKAFLLFMDECHICFVCEGTIRSDCKNMKSARPTAEGLGVDVFTTVRSIGYSIEVLSDYQQEMNRYAFLLVD